MAGLSVHTRFGYGVGHVLNDLCSAMWFTYLLIYFHHVLLFNNSLSGVVLLIGQVADALATPFVGQEADRTDDLPFCTRYGRRKTWHLLGTACVICAFPFIFLGCLGCNYSHDWAQVIYYAPFVVIFQFGWAATQISHLALIPSITQDPHDRTELNAVRYGFTVMSNITVYIVTWLVLGLDTTSSSSGVGPEDGAKFRYIVLIVLLIGAAFAGVFHALVKESKTPQYENMSPDVEVNTSSDAHGSQMHPDDSTSRDRSLPVPHCVPTHFRMTSTDWLKNHQFYQVAVLYMGTRLFCNLTQAYVPIYLQDSLHMPEESVAYIPLVMYIAGFLMTTVMRSLNKFIGRKASFILGSIIGGSACIAVWFGTGNLYKKYILYVVASLLGAGGSIMLITSLSITADLIGPNVESGAFVYGAMSFTDKLSNGVAIMLIQNLNPCTNCCPMCSSYYRDVLFYCCGGASLLSLLAILTLLPIKIGDRRKGKESGDSIREHSGTSDGVGGPEVSTSSCPNSRMSTVACIGPSVSTMAAAGVGPGLSICSGDGTGKLPETAEQSGSEEYTAVPQGLRARVTSASDDDDDGVDVLP
ncbi:major facilitator superfamily domain-containing protein 12-like isoform X2 [Panulirus ornatus]|uniref:major facilitator superfamily domain-containing protein 12-like isoform X2 n=1 Tax=Panulirus ornatus TaxID=150431 RepID=UPI003A874AFF